MDKKEFVESFIETLRKGDSEKIYKFFTSRTTVMFVNENKLITMDEAITYLKDTFFNQEIEIVREFESSVCIKLELKSEKFKYDAFLIEVESRRIKRLEIM